MARTTSSSVGNLAVAGASASGTPGRTSVLNVLITLRPSQWTKNLLVFAGILFGHRLFEPAAIVAAVAAFVIFCALSGVVYLVNDITDRAGDRLHPLKATRPIASGALPVPTALAFAAFIAAAALAGSFAISWRFAGVALAYLVLQSLYSGPLKHVIIIDALTIASKSVIGFWSARSCWRCSSRSPNGVMRSCCSPTARPAIGPSSANTVRIFWIR